MLKFDAIDFLYRLQNDCYKALYRRPYARTLYVATVACAKNSSMTGWPVTWM